MENNFLSIKKPFKDNNKSIIANYIYLVISIIYISIILYGTGIKSFLYNTIKYLTNWGFILNLLYSILKIINRKNSKFMDIYFNVSFNIEFILCVAYWVVLAKYITVESLGLIGCFMCHSIHVFPLFFVLAEFYLDKNIKFSYINFLYVIVLLLLYELNDLFFTVVLKDEPYPIGDKQAKMFIQIFILISIILIHFCFTYLKKSYLTIKKITFLNQYII